MAAMESSKQGYFPHNQTSSVKLFNSLQCLLFIEQVKIANCSLFKVDGL